MQTYISKPCAIDNFPDSNFRFWPLIKNGVRVVFISMTEKLKGLEKKWTQFLKMNFLEK